MTRVRARARFGMGAAIAALGAIGCGAKQPAKAPAGPTQVNATSEIERYLPLENGTVFSYDTTSESSGNRGTLIVQISRPREGRVDLRMGAKTERLEIAPDGVTYVEGGYFLKAPIEKGRTWKSKTGTVRLDAIDESVTVPAGHFDGCLKTVEETRDPGVYRATRTTICPHVGLVELDVEATTDSGHERETAVLKSFGPRVDIAVGDSTTTTTTTDDGATPLAPQ